MISPSLLLTSFSWFNLGPANYSPTKVANKPFPTSVLKVIILEFLLWVFATITKICTNGTSTLIHIKSFFGLIINVYK